MAITQSMFDIFNRFLTFKVIFMLFPSIIFDALSQNEKQIFDDVTLRYSIQLSNESRLPVFVISGSCMSFQASVMVHQKLVNFTSENAPPINTFDQSTNVYLKNFEAYVYLK